MSMQIIQIFLFIITLITPIWRMFGWKFGGCLLDIWWMFIPGGLQTSMFTTTLELQKVLWTVMGAGEAGGRRGKLIGLFLFIFSI